MRIGIITLGITLAFAALVTATNGSSSGNNIVKRNALEEGVEGAPPSNGELRDGVAGQNDPNSQYGRNKGQRGGGSRNPGGKPVDDGKGGKGKGGLPLTLPGAPALPLDGLPPVGKLTGGLPAVGDLAGGLSGANKLTGGLPAVGSLSADKLPDTGALLGGLTNAGKITDASQVTKDLPIGKGSPLGGVGVDTLTKASGIGGGNGSPLGKILG